METPEGLAVGEAAAGGQVKYSSLEGESYEAALAFLSGETVEEPTTDATHDATLYRVPPSDDYFERLSKKDDQDKKKKRRRRGALKMEAAPVPQFSRREALAEVAIESYPDFAEAIVNRLWALLLGRGIVHPVDHLDTIHPPSHPELLHWLGRDFSAHGYDMKRLVREIMASQAYQLASNPAENQPRPADETFACGLVRPLSAESLYRSMLIAGGHVPDDSGEFSGIDEGPYREAFAKVYPTLFPETFSPRAAEGMFFTNNPLMNEIITSTFEALSPAEMVEEAFSQSFGRLPDDEEQAASLAFLGDAPDTQRRRSLLWALIASSEFRFNH